MFHKPCHQGNSSRNQDPAVDYFYSAAKLCKSGALWHGFAPALIPDSYRASSSLTPHISTIFKNMVRTAGLSRFCISGAPKSASSVTAPLSAWIIPPPFRYSESALVVIAMVCVFSALMDSAVPAGNDGRSRARRAARLTYRGPPSRQQPRELSRLHGAPLANVARLCAASFFHRTPLCPNQQKGANSSYGTHCSSGGTARHSRVSVRGTHLFVAEYLR